MHREVTACRVCKSTNLVHYLDLGSHPLCNNLIKQSSTTTEVFPVKVLLCRDCHLSQLSIVVDPNLLYRENYLYHSSVSKTFRDHCYELAQTLKPLWKMHPRPEWFYGDDVAWANKQAPRVMDIASNDGCLLREFRRAGYNILGVDPAKNFNTATILHDKVASGTDTSVDDLIPMINEFWSEETAKNISFGTLRPWSGPGSEGCIDFITAQNVFGHVDDLDDFLRGVNYALDDNGVFVVEVPYLPRMFQQNAFDTIYHEHLSYFLLAPLVKLFQSHNLPIFRVTQHPIHCGTIRIFASKAMHPAEPSVQDTLDKEEMDGYYEMSRYIEFASRVDNIRATLRHTIEGLFNFNEKVAGFAASAKGISLLNYCGIKWPYVEYIVDDTPAKQGKIAPGCQIPIVDRSKLERDEPGTIILLAWNFEKEILDKNRGFRGSWIIPIPNVVMI